jgi:ABC-type multidrug transport system ATPase subunit
MSGISLEVEGVDVSFRDICALSDVSIVFGVGVNGILGPNGAGKSTLFRVLTGILRPRKGRILRDSAAITTGRELSVYQSHIGYLPQDPQWFDGFSAQDLCVYFAGLRKVPRQKRLGAAELALELVNLTDKKHEKLGNLSGGQRRRAFIAQALVHEPDILILDEPTSGLDPIQRIKLRELVSALGESRIVLLSTHLVEDVAHISRQVHILDMGKVVWSGSPLEMAQIGVGSERDGVGSGLSQYERGFLSTLGRETK